MIAPSYFIADDSAFGRLRADLEVTVYPDLRLPEVPFKQSFRVLGFEEFDWAMSGEFWPVLQKLASQSGDQELVFAVLDPDPVNYFKAMFGYYNWAILPATLSSNDYWNFLNTDPTESPADSMLGNAQAVIFTVPSKRWLIWGERESGLCVLASAYGDTVPAWNNLDWVMDLRPTEDWKGFASVHRHRRRRRAGCRRIRPQQSRPR